jgi:hypothetical protein
MRSTSPRAPLPCRRLPDVEALSVPIGRIVIVCVLAGLAGVLAAILPTHRAARLDVLKAVSQE